MKITKRQLKGLIKEVIEEAKSHADTEFVEAFTDNQQMMRFLKGINTFSGPVHSTPDQWQPTSKLMLNDKMFIGGGPLYAHRLQKKYNKLVDAASNESVSPTDGYIIEVEGEDDNSIIFGGGGDTGAITVLDVEDNLIKYVREDELNLMDYFDPKEKVVISIFTNSDSSSVGSESDNFQ